MKTSVPRIVALLASACVLAATSPAFAQAKAAEGKKTGGRNATGPAASPEIHADRTVTFRLRAPNAKEVNVTGEIPGGNKAMTKDEQGVWSVTVGPLPPELYGYGFTVDGLRIADPGNALLKPMRSEERRVGKECRSRW